MRITKLLLCDFVVTMGKYEKILYALLRAAMTGGTFDEALTDDEWRWLYKAAMKQSLLGVCYVNRADMPMDVAMTWAATVESIRGLNKLLNEEAARLSKLFADQGRKTAILKGQANARLYPDPYSRHPGDIDLWVEGGRDSVVAMLNDLQILSDDKILYHHAHMKTDNSSIKVDIHFRPSPGNKNPITNRRLQKWLEEEIKNTTRVDLGFNVPTVRFALVMQLAHIQYHFLASGIGLRHICDYYWLLKNATEEDRQAVRKVLKSFGLQHSAEALMWLLGEVLHLEEELMYCKKDRRRGEWMLRVIMAGGNFGMFAERRNNSLLRRAVAGRLRHLKLMRFDFWEVFWMEAIVWKNIIKTMPLRIKRML